METQYVSLPRLGYSFAEVELMTGLSRSSLYRMVDRGELQTIKHGRRRLIPEKQLRKFSAVSVAQSA
jgi:excisionase family DNA binding protein